MDLPRTGSHSPLYQSFRCGWVISSAVSCEKGDAVMSIGAAGMYFLAASLVAMASALKISQSVFDSQTGATAADSGCMNECRSVLFMSAFSYQDAAGRTMSEYSAEESMRKFRSTTRSILPTGATSCHCTSFG